MDLDTLLELKLSMPPQVFFVKVEMSTFLVRGRIWSIPSPGLKLNRIAHALSIHIPKHKIASGDLLLEPSPRSLPVLLAKMG